MIKDYLDKLRNKPERERRVILWVSVGSLALVMLVFWWFFIFQRIVKNMDRERLMQNFGAREFKEKMNALPSPKLPDFPAGASGDMDISEEEFNKLLEEEGL